MDKEPVYVVLVKRLKICVSSDLPVPKSYCAKIIVTIIDQGNDIMGDTLFFQFLRSKSQEIGELWLLPGEIRAQRKCFDQLDPIVGSGIEADMVYG